MFNGAWFAGMEFVEWRAHSVWIPDRYIPGREATVFWGALDMRFKNNHPTGIFITTEMTNTSVTIKFWGTKQWDEIDTIIGEKRNVSQPEVIYNTDPDCHSQTGVIGFRITTYRTFFRDGVEVKRQAFNTSYRPSPSVVCSAKPTKKPSPSPTKTKKPTTSPSPSTSATPA
jgi:vancomycin resistance protein YoaR